MSGAVLCMVLPSVLDSQNKRQRWCQVRRRVTDDDPRTERNDDEKKVETFPVARVVVFLLGRPSVFLVPGLVPCLPLSSWFQLLGWLSWERATTQEPILSFPRP